ncbi:hypothetical protein COCNU_08G002320 [Cocos nucifera]|uniref:Uncharacterized protein n=1 Tax=Cocos nucifera TaxID=13894 RepID=A0A8K0IH65_COCNU|nr:hypothetical protein COCNU_08G002320 [Cocos nucifera]
MAASSSLLSPPSIAGPPIRNPNRNRANSSLLDRGLGLGFLPYRTLAHPKKPSLHIRTVQTDRWPSRPSGGGADAGDDAIQRFLKRDYKWGFVSDIESFSIPKGLRRTPSALYRPSRVSPSGCSASASTPSAASSPSASRGGRTAATRPSTSSPSGSPSTNPSSTPSSPSIYLDRARRIMRPPRKKARTTL